MPRRSLSEAVARRARGTRTRQLASVHEAHERGSSLLRRSSDDLLDVSGSRSSTRGANRIEYASVERSASNRGARLQPIGRASGPRCRTTRGRSSIGLRPSIRWMAERVSDNVCDAPTGAPSKFGDGHTCNELFERAGHWRNHAPTARALSPQSRSVALDQVVGSVAGPGSGSAAARRRDADRRRRSYALATSRRTSG
jgi:hypothetical protein